MPNVSKSVSAIENKTNTSSRDSFQDPCLEIDGKTQLRNQRVASKSFQDHPPSSFKTMATCTCTETPFNTPANTQGRREQYKLTHFKTLGVDGMRVIREMCTKIPFKTPTNTWGRREQNRHKLTPFKTPGVDVISIIREKDNADQVKDTVKNRGKETSFKTPGKSGRKNVALIEFLSRP